MKIALVHDYLGTIGGSERIFQYICEEFPEADIYTLAYNASKTFPFYSTRKIHSTWLNKFIQSPQAFRKSFPLATYVMQKIDLSEYNIAFSFSATVAKYISVQNGKHICYCLIPTRAIWHFDKYFGNNIEAKIFKLLLPYLKKRDYNAAQRINYFIAISNISKKYIKQYYNRTSEVIYSPIEVNKFFISDRKKDHYLIVSRLEHWKNVDYAIDAFNRLGLPLKIIGSGQEESKLRAMARPNISFLGEVDDNTLIREYSEALAVVFTPYLEYGLIPLEANASGTPVICYGRGGVEETMIPADSIGTSDEPPTAIFYYEQTADSLIAAIKHFESREFKPIKLKRHAAKWSVESFKKSIREYVTKIHQL